MAAILYLNTDLDLESDEDLRPLTRAMNRGGLFTLHVAQSKDGGWFARMETEKEFSKPNANISAILNAVAGLSDKTRAIWDRCTLREFNIGYECGDKPWAYNHGLSNRTLRRMAAVDATLRFTLYPPESEQTCTIQHSPTSDR